MNNEEKILSILEKHSSMLETLVTKVDKLETDLAEVKTDLTGVKTDLAGVKTDLAGVKTDLTGVKTDLAGVKTDLTGVKTVLAETKDHVIIIENDHGKSLGALHDGYAQNYQITVGIRADIAKLQAGMEMHDLRIKVLESARRKSSLKFTRRDCRVLFFSTTHKQLNNINDTGR